MKFPSALTILLSNAALVAISNRLTRSFSYESLFFTSEADTSILNCVDESSIFPATRQALDEPGIKILLNNFTSSYIYRPVSVAGSLMQVAAVTRNFLH